ncbi:MAG: DUF1549 and DUF1553 domain-containing protein, partial [Planctomycetes bacterium]|nr:DUF1549 and DUF1553 domain-containing protein [Planctomycetota bacterium]
IKEWISQGANWTKNSGKVETLSMTPKEYVFCESGKTAQVRVTAKFVDGSEEDITSFCDFRIQDDAIATMSVSGLVSAQKPGDSGLAISYRGNVISARILVPTPVKPGFQYPKLAEVNYIDREVNAKLRQMNVIPSALSSDTEFLRRVYIDTIGSLPAPDDVRAFIADKNPNKREKKIDELLAHPLHAALWATKLSDITGNNTDALENPQNQRPIRSQQWHDWLRKRVADNMPYDEIVKNILTATSRDDMSPKDWVEHVKLVDTVMAKGFDTSHYAERQSLDLFWRRQQNVAPDIWGQKVAAAFMGVRLECAECHKHPTDRWTQSDYRSFANLFTQVSFAANAFSSPEVKKAVDAENAARRTVNPKQNQISLVREVFAGSPGGRGGNLMTEVDTGRVLPPKAPLGPEFKFTAGKDVRSDLFEWLRGADNPFFARSFINRVWAHYTGVGLVEPVDDFSLANPPTNARLLDALAKDFVESKFNLRVMEKKILMSRSYQASSTPNETNRFDKNNFSRAYIRPMMAEVVVDVLNTALDVNETGGNDVPSGKRIIEIGSSRFQNVNVAYALRIFGRPPRTSACDCERVMEPALPQTLYRMTDPAILAKLRANNNRLAQLTKTKMSDDEILTELFLATLARVPSADELAAFQAHRKASSDRSAAFVDTMWALINTREFVLNH